MAEEVFCVPRGEMFGAEAWQGLRTEGLGEKLTVIRQKGRFVDRASAETDPGLQQIIPYCVVYRTDLQAYFLMNRLRGGTESRLHDLYSLGVGGHINPVDNQGVAGDPIAAGLRREWAEELVAEGEASAQLGGFLKDDSNPVSAVHFGLVFLVSVTGVEVGIRETDKLDGRFYAKGELSQFRGRLEPWSEIVLDGIESGRLGPDGQNGPLLRLAATAGRGAAGRGL